MGAPRLKAAACAAATAGKLQLLRLSRTHGGKFSQLGFPLQKERNEDRVARTL